VVPERTLGGTAVNVIIATGTAGGEVTALTTAAVVGRRDFEWSWTYEEV